MTRLKIRYRGAGARIRYTCFAGITPILDRLWTSLHVYFYDCGFKKDSGFQPDQLFLVYTAKTLTHTPTLDKHAALLKKDPFLAALCRLDPEDTPDRSTLARNSSFFPHRDLERLFDQLSASLQLKRNYRGRGLDLAFDSSFLEVYGKTYQQAKKGYAPRKKGLRGYKLAVAFDVRTRRPLCFVLTSGNVSECAVFGWLYTKSKQVLGKATLRTILLDKGFYDSKIFDWLERDGVGFIIPAKDYKYVLETMKGVNEFMTDKKHKVKVGEAYTEVNGFPCRLVVKVELDGKKRAALVKTLSGKRRKEVGLPDGRLGYLTNMRAEQAIRVLRRFKQRWRVEYFFRELKQDLWIGRFPGTQFDTVYAHVFFVLLAYLGVELQREGGEEDRRRGIGVVRERLVEVGGLIEVKDTWVQVTVSEAWWPL